MELKIRKKVFNVSEKDRVLFNGACYILLTQKVRDGWHDVNPTVPKTTMKKLIKEGKAVLMEEKYTSNWTTKEMDLYTFCS